MKGLEPPRRETQDPKSCAATNYATPAGIFSLQKTECKVTDFFCFMVKFRKKNKRGRSMFNRLKDIILNLKTQVP
jgi:hypothetical protein